MTPSEVVQFRKNLQSLCQQFQVRLHTERITYNQQTKLPHKYHFELTAEVTQEIVDLIEQKEYKHGHVTR